MKIMLVGDIHGRFDQFSEGYRRVVREEGSPDCLIQVGDFGFWPREVRVPAPLFDLGHPCLWIDGNHEDFQSLSFFDHPTFGMSMNTKELLDWKKSQELWTYQPRGSYWNGFLFIGGARSIDSRHRVRGWDWFPEENISYGDQVKVFDTITRVGAENIHTVISHDCPGSFDVAEACIYSKTDIIDGNRKFLQAVLEEVRPQNWFFGHYHKEMSGICPETNCQWRCIDMTRPEGVDYVLIDVPDNGK